MLHPFRSKIVALAQALCVCVLLCWSASLACGQNLAFTPGIAGTYAGDPTGAHSVSSGTYTGPLNNWTITYSSPGVPVYTGSGLIMTFPTSLALDSNSDMYIVDRTHTIRVAASSATPIPAYPGVTPQAGYVYTIGGNGTTASTCTTGDTWGNGCPATEAAINTTALAVDANGNVFFGDQTSCQVRVIYAKGTIPGLSNPVAGNIYAIAGTGTCTTYKTVPTGDGGPATSAQISIVNSVAVDSHGNIFINDNGDYAIRVIYVAGSIPGLPASPVPGNLYTIAGTLGTSCTISATNACGNGGPATAAQFAYIYGMTLDSSGNIYLGESNNARVRAIYVAGSLPGISNPTVGDVYTVAGAGSTGATTLGGQATAFKLQGPQYVAFDPAGNLYISDSTNKAVYRVDPTGVITLVFGGTACAAKTDTEGDGCPANAATLTPQGIVFDSADNLYVADELNGLIREVNVASSAVAFTGTYGLTIPSQVVNIYNPSTQTLKLSSITTDAPFTQVATGGSTDCDSSTSLAPGAGCQIGVGITAPTGGSFTGTLQIGSNATNATSGQNTVNLSAAIATAGSSTVLTASPAAPAQVGSGQPVTFTATVLPQTGVSTIPTGTVTFNNGATVLASNVQLNSSGVATYTTSSLAAGSYVVTAAYSGDTDFSVSTSNATFVTVASTAVPTITLTASPTSATAGQSVTLTATVTPPSGGAAPTGTIVFQDGVTPISSAIALSGGSATFSTTSLPMGSNTLYAVYSGNLAANDSTGVVVTVGANAQLQFTPGLITSVAGSYSSGYAGDGGAATSAKIYHPTTPVYDANGNLYFVDVYNDVVRVVASGKGTIPGIANPVAGNIYTVAGVQGKTCSSTALPCGDGGAATSAYLNFGYSGSAAVAVDLSGNLYIADSGDSAIRKVSLDGTISTVAGTLGSDTYTSAGDGGLATKATISLVIPDITVDNAGNLYIIDDSAVRKVDAQTQIITTIAGSPTASGYSGDGGAATAAKLSSPNSIALDGQGNLYIADTGNEVVREVSAQTGIISTVAGYNYNASTLRCEFGVNTCFHGDGEPATQAQLYTPNSVSVDAAGNLYISDYGNYVVRMVDAQTGIINTIAGQAGQYCGSGPCGDGSPATSATFGGVTALSLDSASDLTLTDTANAVRNITAGSTTLSFGSTNLGDIVGQSVTVTNIGSQPLTITGITATDGFTQAASGGTDCAASTTLAPAQQCIIDVQFFPTDAKAYTGTITVASNSSNATNGNNVITLSGTGVANSGTTPQTISFSTPPAPYYQGMQIPLNGAATPSNLPVEYQVVSGPGLILNNGTASASLKITGAGTIIVAAYQFGDSNYAAASNNGVTVSLKAVQPQLTIQPITQSITQGQQVPAFTSATDYTVTGQFIPGDSQSSLTGQPSIYVTDSSGNIIPVGSTPEAGQYILAIKQGTLVAPSYYLLNFQPGQFNVTGTNPQTVAFQAPLPPSNVTYGMAPITLSAVAIDSVTGKADGGSILYSVSPTSDTVTPATPTLNPAVLTVTGAGTISVTATQSGTDYYKSASTTQTITVAKAPLTVAAYNQTLAQGVGLPSLNASSGTYSFSGFVNGETSAVLTGAPTLTIVDSNGNVLAPGATPPVGTYTIQIIQGSLASSNYAFSFVNGTLKVVQGQSQTVTFPAIPNVTYGAAPIALSATASSGLGVAYSVVSGPAKVAGNMLSIQGAGTITVQATQAGNNTYSPASATQSFNVGPALLTVIAASVSRPNNTPNPPLTGYTITGFVNGDTQAVVSGTPAISTTALPGSPVGTYPIVIAQQPKNSAQNPIAAANYTFAFVNGTLTVAPGGPTPDFSLTATPAVLGIPQGQIQQTTITLSPTNYYEGTVKLSCGNLPANMTCVFSPSALSADGTGNTVTGTLTINTNGSSTVEAQNSPRRGPLVLPAAVFYLPGELAALVVALCRRKRTKNKRMTHLLILLILLTGACGLTACAGGSSSSSSQYAAPGSYTVTFSAADSTGGPSHSINLTVDVQ